MLKVMLSFGIAAIAGAILANSFITTKTANLNNYQNYKGLYRVYSNSPNSSTAPVSTPSPASSDPTTSSVSPISDVTSNWAGYVSSGGSYSAVSGSWTVPSVTSDDEPMAADASWIGIGGVSSDDLIQAGTQNLVEDGQVTTGAFYEQLPDTSQTIPTVNVNPGDDVSVTIDETSPGEWFISVKDNTTGQSYSNTVTYDSSQSSAEWIEEAPSDQSGIMPLDEFGSVGFTSGTTDENGNNVTIAGSNAQAINMDDEEGQALTSVSPITDGGDFTVTRTDASDDSLASSESDSGFSNFPSRWSRHEPGLSTSIGGYYLGDR